ncbi:MAG: hypothetical protein WEF28_02525 [Acidimicrobiia bacterium]
MNTLTHPPSLAESRYGSPEDVPTTPRTVYPPSSGQSTVCSFGLSNRLVRLEVYGFVKTWALLFYGISVGLTIAAILTLLVSDPTGNAFWYVTGAAATLAAGLILHQRVTARSKVRRWRRTSG